MGVNRLLIKYATRSRPNRMLQVIDSVFKNASTPNQICLLLSLDSDDESVYNEHVISQLKPYMEKYNMKVYFGERTTKIGAINRDIDKITDWEYLMPITDFTEICQKSFDLNILNALHIADLTMLDSINTNGRKHHQIPIIKKRDYDSYGYLYNPNLNSNFEIEELLIRFYDDDYIVRNISNKMYRFVHPRWMYLSHDGLHVENLSSWKQDLHTLEKVKNDIDERALLRFADLLEIK
jgi:hypothetical protein